MHIIASFPVELSDLQVKEIVRAYLERLKEGRWIRDGRVYEEHHTSHSFETVVGTADEERFQVLAAVEDFEDILKRAGRL